MRFPECPDQVAWRRFILGQIQGGEALALEEHLLACGQCGSRLEASDAEDDIVAALRSSSHILDSATETMTTAFGTTSTMSVAQAEDNGLDQELDLGSIERPAGYRIVRVLGRGGSGVVYLAEDERLGRFVALKVILDVHLRESHYLARFEREAQLLARLQHPGIVRIHEVGTIRGRPYLALEYVSGESLAQRLKGQPLPVPDVTRLFRELVQAVQYAHEQGVVHRDLKPGNILMSSAVAGLQSGEAGSFSIKSPPQYLSTPKITDFGLARRLDEEGLTRTGDVLGTPGYMAPEQIGCPNPSSSPTVDVYSLGAILYELLTGRPPFRGGTVLETLEQARTLDPVPLRRLRPGLPRDLETICLKCLEKDPSRRYASACSLADDIERFHDGKPIHARPVSSVGKLSKWVRRRPALAILAGVTTLCLLALGVGGVVYEHQLRQALQEAHDAGGRADQQAQAAKRNALRADTNYQQARDAVQKMLTRTQDPRWNAVPRLQQLRREQVEIALAFFASLAAQTSNDLQVRRDVAWAHLEAGKLQIALDRTEQGLNSLRQALHLCDQLLREHPTQDNLRLLRANALMALGAYVSGREALQYGEQGVEELEQLYRRDAPMPEVQATLVSACITLGGTYIKSGEPAFAQRMLQRAAQLSDDMVREMPQDQQRLALRARVRINLSAAYRQGKQQDKAREQHAQAEADLEQLFAQDPLDRQTIDGLAVLRLNGAYDLQAEGKPGEAAAYVQRNVPMLEQALQREPDDAGYRDRIFRTWGVTAMMLRADGKARDAALAWDKLLLYAPDAEKRGRLWEGVEFWIETKDHARAAAVADRSRQCLEQQPDAKSWNALAKQWDSIADLAAKNSALPPHEREQLVKRHRAAAQHAREQAQATIIPPTK